jgi:hypothetical protein
MRIWISYPALPARKFMFDPSIAPTLKNTAIVAILESRRRRCLGPSLFYLLWYAQRDPASADKPLFDLMKQGLRFRMNELP